MAIGTAANASGTGVTAIGDGAQAIGVQNVAIGTRARSLGATTNNISMGTDATSIGTSALAIGTATVADGFQVSAFGAMSSATGSNSSAFGPAATASGTQTTAMGPSATAVGTQSTAVGPYATAIGLQSTAIGYGATAANPGQVTIGNSSSVLTLPGLGNSGVFAQRKNQPGATASSTRVITTDGEGNLGTSFSPQSVMNAIQSTGAFGAALAAVPNVTMGDEVIRCGFGGGQYSNAVATSVGCAFRIGRIYLNAAAAYTPSVELQTVGPLNGFGTRFGFSFPIGRINPDKSRAPNDISNELRTLSKVSQAETLAVREDLEDTRKEIAEIRKENEELKSERMLQLSMIERLGERLKQLEQLINRARHN